MKTAISCMLTLFVLAITSPVYGDDIGVDSVRAPDRNGDAEGLGDNTSCPPGPDKNTKGEPTDAKDKDVNSDQVKDFFMGQWIFVKGEDDLIVTKWCINNRRGPNGEYNDYFSYEIERSKNGQPIAPPAVTAGACW